MKSKACYPVFTLACVISAIMWLPIANPSIVHAQQSSLSKPAAEFTHAETAAWINSPPLTLTDLRGKVVLIDFWTFDCWNCYRSIPWLKSLEQRYASQGLQIIGVHAPEFTHERKRKNVVAKVKEFGLEHPVMIDNDFSYWNALGNRYWPAFYFVDKHGRIRAVMVGETHIGDRRALSIERVLEKLLKE